MIRANPFHSCHRRFYPSSEGRYPLRCCIQCFLSVAVPQTEISPRFPISRDPQHPKPFRLAGRPTGGRSVFRLLLCSGFRLVGTATGSRITNMKRPSQFLMRRPLQYIYIINESLPACSYWFPYYWSCGQYKCPAKARSRSRWL